MNEQPAIKSYFFEKGFKDLSATIKDSWEANILASKNEFYEAKTTESVVKKILHTFGGFSVMIFGTSFFTIISVFHITILLLFFVLVFLSYSVFWAIDALYRVKNKVFTACPNCYEKSILPVYHCPKCNAHHTELWPGRYGILKRICKCGQKLPTSFFNGRSKLTASCPSCTNTIESLEATPVIIPIIGAPSVGKTFFLFSMVHEIKEKLTPQMGAKFSFMNDYNQSIYNSQIATLNAKNALPKTTENNPVALNFFLEKAGKRSLFFFYDSAGEAFTNTTNLAKHKFYNYLHGIIFVIDPFSIPEVYNKYQNEIKLNTKVRNSNYPLEDVYDASIINLEKNYGYKTTDTIKKTVAIVISKVDFFDLEEYIGEGAGRKIMATDPKVKTMGEAIDRACRLFLTNNGMGAILRKIESKFPESHFFSVSSMGGDSVRVDSVSSYLLDKTKP